MTPGKCHVMAQVSHVADQLKHLSKGNTLGPSTVSISFLSKLNMKAHVTSNTSNDQKGEVIGSKLHEGHPAWQNITEWPG